MATGEFELIDNYFTHRLPERDDVIIGIGDDGAVLDVPAGFQLVVVTDTLVENVHFDRQTSARALGHKAVAVNLSDLAAMGAEPTWISLALTLPHSDDEWLNSFSHGLREICDYFNCQLVGGDTTRGPLTITVTAHGVVPKGKAIQRRGAKPGDWLYVSHSLGDAGLALASQKHQVNISSEHFRQVSERLHFPTPRVALGQALRDVASSAIDISDGLLADLGHILRASQVGAVISLEEIPLSLAMTESVSQEQALRYALTSGDDYELCFTVSEDQRGVFDTKLATLGCKPVCIGRITGQAEKIELKLAGEPWQFELPQTGYQHFREPLEAS
ncbi:thiamine-phosphate kinase [Pseudidiomarina taiwanensis]|uniref:Thiamine-monophosphate kinase n=1 Tax=Pseudidiomarina taiwanensis TaxID=337250 RepID=A0A432ZCI9_9GAMM|nr:thiamine-phosphate kinase [Pseudidiomarina taiwanensis]RUO75656.1 thiamine-phosphate kinase [Pseudidiomarina taiwanensis]